MNEFTDHVTESRSYILYQMTAVINETRQLLRLSEEDGMRLARLAFQQAMDMERDDREQMAG